MLSYFQLFTPIVSLLTQYCCCQQAQHRAGEAYDSAAKTVSENTQVAKDRASEAMDSTKAQAQVGVDIQLSKHWFAYLSYELVVYVLVIPAVCWCALSGSEQLHRQVLSCWAERGSRGACITVGIVQ